MTLMFKKDFPPGYQPILGVYRGTGLLWIDHYYNNALHIIKKTTRSIL